MKVSASKLKDCVRCTAGIHRNGLETPTLACSNFGACAVIFPEAKIYYNYVKDSHVADTKSVAHLN